MTPLAVAILTALLSLSPPWRSEEPRVEYQARLEMIATAVAIEAPKAGMVYDTAETAGAVVAIVYGESGLAADVHSGTRKGDRGRAVCLAQLHASGLVPLEEWRALAGIDLDATRRCVRAALRVLAAQDRRCRARAQGKPVQEALSRAIAAYGSGGRCEPTAQSEGRSRRALRIAEMVRRSMRESRPQTAEPDLPGPAASLPSASGRS